VQALAICSDPGAAQEKSTHGVATIRPQYSHVTPGLKADSTSKCDAFVGKEYLMRGSEAERFSGAAAAGIVGAQAGVVAAAAGGEQPVVAVVAVVFADQRAPKEVTLGGAPKEVLLGDAPKEVTLGGAGFVERRGPAVAGAVIGQADALRRGDVVGAGEGQRVSATPGFTADTPRYGRPARWRRLR